MTRVALVGYGRFGRAFANLVTESGFSVRAYDPYVSVPDGMRAESVADVVAGADLVVLAAPVPVMPSAVSAVAPHVRPDQLVMDVGSVKVRPVAALEAGLGARIPWVGTHPLFGPLSLTLAERPLRVVVCPTALHPGAARRARAFYEGLGCVIVEQSAEEHDMAMARTHALAFFIAKGVIDADQALADDPPPFVPPSFQGLARTMQAVRADAGHLYRALQRDNPFAADVRQALIEALVHADRTLASEQASPGQATEGPESLTIPDLGQRSPELQEARTHIDALDRELTALLARRAELSARAGRAKRALGHGVLDANREAEVMAQRRRWAEEQGLDPAAVDDVFQAILRLSRSVQRRGD
ncbi:prephenate dehydrogenase/arogenate dehydrogenase family protein [Pendulispora albinea]|uniref:chorismate mutase n=1 Tax=Pendulispora albinea TaxID=2741071 RepID=A0ABZ2LUZ2_9BACT